MVQLSECQIFINIAAPSINSAFILLLLVLLFAVHLESKNTFEDKKQFMITTLMFFTQIVFLSLECAFDALNDCDINENGRGNAEVDKRMSLATGIHYVLRHLTGTLQYELLLFYFFRQMRQTFGSANQFEISTRVVQSFYFIFGFSFLLIVARTTVHLIGIVTGSLIMWTLKTMLEPIIFIILLILMIASNYLMIHKLIKLMRFIKDEEMIAVISKLTILSSFCLASFLISFGTFFCANFYVKSGHSNHLRIYFVSQMVWCCDVVVNFLCVFLSFKHTNKYYEKMFGGIDRNCKSLCNETIDAAAPPKAEKNLELVIQQTTTDKAENTFKNDITVFF